MDSDLKQIERDAIARAKKATTQQEVGLLRSEVLGKKGSLGQALRALGELPADERRGAGEEINKSKAAIEAALSEAAERLVAVSQAAALEAARYDVTLPGRRVVRGAAHPLRLIEEDIVRCLSAQGFVTVEGPLVEHDWYNFEALNMPADHPARDMQDTFFVSPSVVLRTHTSNVQIRAMLKRRPPVRIMTVGMVFRHDEVDPTHSPVFHQVEGLWIDEKATFAELKGVLTKLAAHLFGPQVSVRFRPSFFPFTEPSAEVDVSCVVCGGGRASSCRVCKGTGWLEILGSGMVHPAVLEAVGYDPEKVQGFAFGAGVERIAMLRWGVEDIRFFFENDLRFLRQFSPAPDMG